MLDFTTIMHIPGCLHILHNICKGATNSMAKFCNMKLGMKALASFLADKHYREAMTTMCFGEGQAALHAWRFRTFQASLTDWRWGSICEFIKAMEPLEKAFASLLELGHVLRAPTRRARARVNNAVAEAEGADDGR